jgi:hypothetical protein
MTPTSFARCVFGGISTMLAAGMILAGCQSSGLSVREGAVHNVSNYILALSVPQPTTAPVAGEPAAAAARPAPLRPPIRLAVAQVGEVAAPQAFLQVLRDQPELFARLDVVPAAAFTDDAARLKSAQRLRDRLAEELARELINKPNAARDRTASAG